MKLNRRVAECAFLICVALPVLADPINEDSTLTARDAAAGDQFGSSVSIFGTTAIVGAPRDSATGAGSPFAPGSAYVFNAITGRQLFKLSTTNAAPRDKFGSTVAISGTTAIVGAPGSDAFGPFPGSAYVYSTTTGQQLAELEAENATGGDFFGTSVAVFGTTAIVGAWFHDGPQGSNTGSAYLFSTTTGEQLFELTAGDDAARFDGFGRSVAISGTTAIVGATTDAGGGALGPGSAYLFDTTTGERLFKLTASDGEEGDRFGISVAISGTTAIVGALFHDGGAGNNAGAAYIFDTTTGLQTLKISASDPAIQNLFGGSVAMSGTTAIIGSSGSDSTAGSLTGAAYLFDTTTGRQLTKITASDAEPIDQFGLSVSLSGTTAVVGSFIDTDEGFDQGTAYVIYTQPCPADLNCDGLLNFDDLPLFLTAFGNMEDAADFNGDSSFDFDDVVAFLNEFALGCP